jgi:hypothetical protein
MSSCVVRGCLIGGDAGTNAAKSENTDSTNWENSGVGSYNADLGSYMSNVNSALAAGNPYQSTAYKTSQNLETSGAMNAADTAAKAATRGAALRTGENAAAVNPSTSENALAAQRTQDTYNATRDTANDQAWEQEKQGLMGQQLAGANSQAAANANYGQQRSSATQGLLSQQEQEDQMWAGLGTAAMGDLGKGLTAAYT